MLDVIKQFEDELTLLSSEVEEGKLDGQHPSHRRLLWQDWNGKVENLKKTSEQYQQMYQEKIKEDDEVDASATSQEAGLVNWVAVPASKVRRKVRFLVHQWREVLAQIYEHGQIHHLDPIPENHINHEDDAGGAGGLSSDDALNASISDASGPPDGAQRSTPPPEV